MNFSVYVDDNLIEEVNHQAAILDRSRNSIIVEALMLWLGTQHHHAWPKNFFDFKPAKDVPDFKASRKRLKAPKKDPLK